MGAGKRAATQAPVTRECLLLHQITDRAESPVFQLAHIELPVRGLILRPAQEDVARRLHDALALDHPLALVTLELLPKPLEYGLAGFLDLQEQRSAVAAHKQPDGAKRADAADADHLERDILERISIDETKPVGRQAARVGVEGAPGVDMVAGVALGREVIDKRRPVGDARLLSLDEMGKVVVFRQVVAGPGENTSEFAPERAMLDPLDLASEIDFAVPDFHRRKLRQVAHAAAVCFD